MIARFQARLYLHPSYPPCLMNECASLGCGCAVLVGVRIDTEPPEAVTVASPCCEEHLPLVRRFNDLMRWSLADGGTDRPLVDVAEDLMAEAERESA